MNICFFTAKICSEIDFKFILKSKNISIAIFDIELLNGSRVKVKGYNEIADYCYINLNKGNVVCIEGRINSKIEVIIEKIYI